MELVMSLQNTYNILINNHIMKIYNLIVLRSSIQLSKICGAFTFFHFRPLPPFIKKMAVF